MEYEILEQIAVLGRKGMWSKELNLIRWNRRWDKYDIRDWSDDHTTMSKGVTLTRDEMYNLKLILESLELF